jgi:hypothetical protein
MSSESPLPPSVGIILTKNKPQKVLPGDRISFDTQMSVLRGYAAASGPDKMGVNNNDVAKVVGISPQSVSLCNGFFIESGLLLRDGSKLRPADAVFDYLHAFEWDPETAAQKLNSVLSVTWFAKALVPKLSFRSLSRDEAIGFLAEESKAPKDYAGQLDLLLDYLNAGGVVRAENNSVTKIALQAADPVLERKPQGSEVPTTAPAAPVVLQKDVDQFSIPIPGKAAALISVPKGLDADDWEMLEAMIKQYISRLRKQSGGGA